MDGNKDKCMKEVLQFQNISFMFKCHIYGYVIGFILVKDNNTQ
jgi:hypothetical protein